MNVSATIVRNLARMIGRAPGVFRLAPLEFRTTPQIARDQSDLFSGDDFALSGDLDSDPLDSAVVDEIFRMH